MVTVRFSHARGRITSHFDALVDSGSDRNLLPIGIGEIIGINFKKAKPVTIAGIGGVAIKAYTAKINIWIHDKRYETEADFSPQQQTPLLGRVGFFDLFELVIFDEQKHFIDLKL